MKTRNFLKDSSGSIAVSTVILMVVFVGLMAIVIDLGHVFTVQSELRNAADAAALAGARALMPLTAPPGVDDPPPWPMEDPPPCAQAVQAALDTSVLNRASLKDVYLDPTEVITGFWDFIPVENPRRAGTFSETGCNSTTNAVKVTARMNADRPQGPITMTLAKIFGIDTVDMQVLAIAVVGNLQTLPKDSPGGFLAGDHDFLKKAYDYWKDGNTEQKYYLVLGPAGGQTSCEVADNGSWSLPSGTYEQGFNPTVNDYIDNGTQTDISVGDQVDLKNGQLANTLMNLQNEVINSGYSLDTTMVGVYSDDLGASVGDAWNEKSTPVNSFFNIELTNVWKGNEFKQDPNVQAIIDSMYGVNEQDKIVGVIEFKMKGPASYGGAGGSGLPSNTYGFTVKLVE